MNTTDRQVSSARLSFWMAILALCSSVLLAATKPASRSTHDANTTSQPVTRAASRPATMAALLPRSVPRPPRTIQDVAASVLTYSGGLKSYFEPCGCQADMLGGMARLSTLLSGFRGFGLPLLTVDTGDLFFEEPVISKAKRIQSQMKAEMISELLRANKYKVAGVGPYDLSFGIKRIKALHKRAGLIGVASNLVETKSQKAPFARHVIVEHGGLRFGFLSLTGTPAPKAGQKHSFPKAFWKNKGLTLAPAVNAAQTQVKALRTKGADVIVLLSTLGLTKLSTVLEKVQGVHFAIEGTEEVGLSEPKEVGNAWVMAVPKEGQKHGVLGLYARERQWTWAAVETPAQLRKAVAGMREQIANYQKQAKQMLSQGAAFAPIAQVYTGQAKDLEKKIVVLTKRAKGKPRFKSGKNGLVHNLLPLAKSLPDHPPTVKRIKRYQREVKIANFKALQQIKAIPKTKTGNFYAGVERCKLCHIDAYNFWKKTRHAHAYKTLADKHKQYDLDCIGCHVVGWQKPGGLYDIKKPQRLANVQCENCHSYGGLHASAPQKKNIVRKVPESTCRGCHKGSHHPNFNYKEKLKLVLGKGHGAKRLAELMKK